MYWRRKMGLAEEDTCRLCGAAVETALHAVCECRLISRPDSVSNPKNLVRNPDEAFKVWERWKQAVEHLETPPVPTA